MISRNRKFLLTAGILMVVFGFYFFVFLPRNFKEYKKLNTKRKAMIQKLNQVDQELVQQKMLIQRRVFLDRQVSQAKQRFFSDKDPSVFLEYISQLATESQVDIIQISPLEERSLEGENIIEVPISISAKGSYHQVGYFLNRLETGAKHIAIREVDISSSRDDYFIHDTDMLVSVFVFQEI